MEKILLSCLESRIEDNQSVYSRFLLGPFISGHAVTVATTLRRALLSEVKNIAITALHIQGITHEFSTVVGVRESVLELSLNFQQIILSTPKRTKRVQVGYLHVQGPAIVYANDLKLPDDIECVNPTQYIATLSTEGLLVVKFLIGEKKSFLKSNTSTLNSEKIKKAKAYSSQLNKALLSHEKYELPFILTLQKSSTEDQTFKEENKSDDPSISLKPDKTVTFVEHDDPNLALQRKNLESSSASPSEDRATTRAELELGRIASTQYKTNNDLVKDNELGFVLDKQNLEMPPLFDQSRKITTVNANSSLDQCQPMVGKAKFYNEFNSEVCLRTIIPLDPIFTPVYQVNFGVERDDLSNKVRERVIMEVWTNGSIHPRQAIHEAALLTMSIFSKLRKTFQLDSHSSLGLAANSSFARVRDIRRLQPPVRTVANKNSAGFFKGRLHKTKSVVKDGQLNDDTVSDAESFVKNQDASYRPNSIAPNQPEPRLTNRRLVRPVGKAGFARVAAQLRRLQPQKSNKARLNFDKPKTRALTKYAGFSSAKPRGLLRRGPKVAKRFLYRPSQTEFDLSNYVRPKLNSVSNLGFVRSRHPVALFIQRFGRSQIQGQTFLLEQSFGLKAKFFKGLASQNQRFCGRRLTAAILSETKYNQDNHILKRTSLPSFKVLSTSKADISSLTRATLDRATTGLTNWPNSSGARVAARLRLVRRGRAPLELGRSGVAKFFKSEPHSSVARVRRRACQPTVGSSPTALSKFNKARNHTVGRPEQNLQVEQSSTVESGNQCFAFSPKSDQQIAAFYGRTLFDLDINSILFLVKYRTFSFTRNALRLFGSQQEDSKFLLPIAKQLIRLKMARVINSCLPLVSKRSKLRCKSALPTFGWLGAELTEPQAKTTINGLGSLESLSLQERSSSLQVKPPAAGAVPTYGHKTFGFVRQALDLPNNKLAFNSNSDSYRPNSSGARPRLNFRPAVARSAEFDMAPTLINKILPQTSLEFVKPTKPRLTNRRLIRPVGGILKKQFGFFKFACNSLQTSRRRARQPTVDSVPCQPTVGSGSQTQTKLGQTTYAFVASRAYLGMKPTSLLRMGEVPPLWLPSDFVTLISYTYQTNRPNSSGARPRLTNRSRAATRGELELGQLVRPVMARSVYKSSWNSANRNKVKLNVRLSEASLSVAEHDRCQPTVGNGGLFTNYRSVQPQVLFLLKSAAFDRTLKEEENLELLKRKTYHPILKQDTVTQQLFYKILQEHVNLSVARRRSLGENEPYCWSSSSDFFGCYEHSNARSKSFFQLTTQERLSVLYSSNLDKLSFLSSDLANLSLSLKTYTFLKKKGKKNIANILEDSPNTLFYLLNGDEEMFSEIQRCLLFLGLPLKERS